jgi:hypothetical protein
MLGLEIKLEVKLEGNTEEDRLVDGGMRTALFVRKQLGIKYEQFMIAPKLK